MTDGLRSSAVIVARLHGPGHRRKLFCRPPSKINLYTPP
jgi:hypothetical protein